MMWLLVGVVGLLFFFSSNCYNSKYIVTADFFILFCSLKTVFLIFLKNYFVSHIFFSKRKA